MTLNTDLEPVQQSGESTDTVYMRRMTLSDSRTVSCLTKLNTDQVKLH